MRTLFIDHFLHIVSRKYYFIGTFLAARFGMDVQMIVIEDYHKFLDALHFFFVDTKQPKPTLAAIP